MTEGGGGNSDVPRGWGDQLHARRGALQSRPFMRSYSLPSFVQETGLSRHIRL
jgi:hypothetical protein